MRCCMHCSDLLKDLHPVCLLCDMYVCMCMHVEGVQCGGGSTVWWREYSVVEVKVYLTSVCYRTGLVFCYSGYLEWLVYQTRPISLAHWKLGAGCREKQWPTNDLWPTPTSSKREKWVQLDRLLGVVCKQLTLELLEKPHLSTTTPQASFYSFRNVPMERN